ncbi:hypothetical protein D3C78_17660 [compost metagenome]
MAYAELIALREQLHDTTAGFNASIKSLEIAFDDFPKQINDPIREVHYMFQRSDAVNNDSALLTSYVFWVKTDTTETPLVVQTLDIVETGGKSGIKCTQLTLDEENQNVIFPMAAQALYDAGFIDDARAVDYYEYHGLWQSLAIMTSMYDHHCFENITETEYF